MLDLHPNLTWIFGDRLEKRRAYEECHPEVLWSRLIPKFADHQGVRQFWADRVYRYESLLTNPENAPEKIADDLPIEHSHFDSKLLDAFSEVLGVIHLAELGATQFSIIPRTNRKSPDFTCVWDGLKTAVECKNLRSHRFVEGVMIELFRDAATKMPSSYDFQLVLKRSCRRTLKAAEEGALAELVRRLPQYSLNGEYREILSSDAEVVFEIKAGTGAVCTDSITVSDLENDYPLRSGLCKKVVADVQRALGQLYSDAVADAERRVIVMRWDIPWYGLPIPHDLRDTLKTAVQGKFLELGRRAEVVVFSELGYSFCLADER